MSTMLPEEIEGGRRMEGNSICSKGQFADVMLGWCYNIDELKSWGKRLLVFYLL